MKKIFVLFIVIIFANLTFAKTPIRNIKCETIHPIMCEYVYNDSLSHTLYGPYFLEYNCKNLKSLTIYKEDVYHFDGKNLYVQRFDDLDRLKGIVVLTKLDKATRNALSYLNLPKLTKNELRDIQAKYESQIKLTIEQDNAQFVHRHSQQYKDSVENAQIMIQRLLDLEEFRLRDSIRQAEKHKREVEKHYRDSIKLVREAQRNDSILSACRARNEYLTLFRKKIYVNSAGGVDVVLYYRNNSKKSIKYVWITVKFYNNVDDPITCDIKRTTTAQLEYTGPLESGESARGSWGHVFYNYSAEYIKITEIKIQYMDNSVVTLPSKFYRNDIRELYKLSDVK